MSLKTTLKLRRTLAFRLTIWYALIFSVSSFVAILVFYLVITSVIHDSSQQDLMSDLSEFSSILASKGMDELESLIIQEAKSEGVDKVFIRVLSMQGDLLVSSDVSSWGNIEMSKSALSRLNNSSNHVFEILSIPGSHDKARVLYGIVGPGKVLQIGESLEDEERFVDAFWKVYGPITFGLTAFAALLGWVMANRALVSVKEVTRTALQISKGAFDQRVSVQAKDEEIKTLAATFNAMLDRIVTLITGMREISDNIAHELRSPVTRIRGIAEMTLMTGKDTQEYEDMAANTIEECDNLLAMINTMLEISETEAGTVTLRQEEIDISAVVRDACEFFMAAAEGKNLTLICKQCDNSFIYGDIQKLQRLVINLLDNAVKYTPAGGTITVSVVRSEGQVVLSVEDTGIGISKDALQRIFTRFYRCDKSRSQPGAGLGLSLAMAIARSHGGDIHVKSHPGKGSIFIVTLPRHSSAR
jgi:heavy metal sensor kinase